MATIRVIGISRSHAGQRLLRDVNLNLEHPGVLAVIGSEGSGTEALLTSMCDPTGCDTGSLTVTLSGPKASEQRCLVACPLRIISTEARSLEEVILRGAQADSVPWAIRMSWLGWLMLRERRDAMARDLQEIAERLGFQEALGKPADQVDDEGRLRASIGMALLSKPDMIVVDARSWDDSEAIKTIAEAVIREGVSFVYASETAETALRHDHRMAVLDDGRVLQTGRPNAVRYDPDSLKVARIGGLPESNLLRAALRETGELMLFGQCVDRLRTQAAEGVTVGLLPDTVTVVADGDGNFSGVVQDRTLDGSCHTLRVDVGADAKDLKVVSRNKCQTNTSPGARVGLRIDPNALLLFRADGTRLRLAQLPLRETPKRPPDFDALAEPRLHGPQLH